MIHTTTWMNLENQRQKAAAIVSFNLYEMSSRGKYIRNKKYVSGCLGWEVGWEKERANGE